MERSFFQRSTASPLYPIRVPVYLLDGVIVRVWETPGKQLTSKNSRIQSYLIWWSAEKRFCWISPSEIRTDAIQDYAVPSNRNLEFPIGKLIRAFFFISYQLLHCSILVNSYQAGTVWKLENPEYSNEITLPWVEYALSMPIQNTTLLTRLFIRPNKFFNQKDNSPELTRKECFDKF